MAVFKKNNDYWIDYYCNRKRYREKVGPNKVLAENALRKRKLDIAENKFLGKKNGRVKFDTFADEYEKMHCVHLRSYKRSHEVHLKIWREYFKGKYLDEITVYDIEKFKMKRRDEVLPATINRSLACLKSLFNKAIAWGKYHSVNPVSRVKMFKENNKRMRFLEKEEIHKLINNCDGHLRPIVIVALNTGMRFGELMSLKWTDIDYERHIIYLERTKNDEKRQSPMNDVVCDALMNIPKHSSSPYIFTSHKSNKNPYTTVKKSFFTALKKSDINNFHFHDLRHTFASHLVMNGVDLNTVRELLGHKSINMTLRYAHLSPNHKQKAVDIIGDEMKRMVGMDTIWTPSPDERSSLEKELFPTA